MKQRCVVEVTEKGVEAATVTGVGGIGKLTTSQEFIADRPFIYTITEKSTGAVLFAGKFSGE
jgi:serpin B